MNKTILVLALAAGLTVIAFSSIMTADAFHFKGAVFQKPPTPPPPLTTFIPTQILVNSHPDIPDIIEGRLQMTTFCTGDHVVDVNAHLVKHLNSLGYSTVRGGMVTEEMIGNVEIINSIPTAYSDVDNIDTCD